MVEDGAIHGTGVTKEYGYLRTEKKYVDFQLTLRFKCEADGNSGVFFHTDFKPGTADIVAGSAVRDRSRPRPSHGRHLRRRPQLDRLARAGARDGHPSQRLERAARQRRRQSLHLAPERRAHGRFHRPRRRIVRRLHRSAAPLRRPRQHSVQGHLHPRSLETLIRVSQPVRYPEPGTHERALRAAPPLSCMGGPGTNSVLASTDSTPACALDCSKSRTAQASSSGQAAVSANRTLARAHSTRPDPVRADTFSWPPSQADLDAIEVIDLCPRATPISRPTRRRSSWRRPLSRCRSNLSRPSR